MVQAVIKDGRVELLDPLPAEWEPGTRLSIDRLPDELPDNPEARLKFIEQWATEFEALFSDVDPEQEAADYAKLQANLAEADMQAKEQMRREMCL